VAIRDHARRTVARRGIERWTLNDGAVLFLTE